MPPELIVTGMEPNWVLASSSTVALPMVSEPELIATVPLLLNCSRPALTSVGPL